jgi:hypothetical protein
VRARTCRCWLRVPAILFRRQRLVVVDVVERRAHASPTKATWFQPESFAGGSLVVTAEPTRRPEQLRWPWPESRASFLPFVLR